MTTIRSEEALRVELEALQKEAQKLNEDRIRAETEIKRASEEMEKLEADLRAEFGTSDLAEVERLLKEREEENSRKVDEYRAEIEAARHQLAKVAEALAANKS